MGMIVVVRVVVAADQAFIARVATQLNLVSAIDEGIHKRVDICPPPSGVDPRGRRRCLGDDRA
jgi:hypothetical protein